MMATIPAKMGASKLVPPATVKFLSLLSRNPFAQLPVIPVSWLSLEQYKKPALCGEAVSAISGSKRKLPAGMPGTPVCQLGRAVRLLAPPPPAESPPELESSLHTCSGIYDLA